GYRTADAAAQSCTSLCDLSDAAVVSLELPVGQPQAAQVCGELEQRGFAFAAIKPGDGGDFLVMQFLAAPPAAPTSKIQNEFARDLVACVAGEKGGVHPGAGGSSPRRHRPAAWVQITFLNELALRSSINGNCWKPSPSGVNV